MVEEETPGESVAVARFGGDLHYRRTATIHVDDFNYLFTVQRQTLVSGHGVTIRIVNTTIFQMSPDASIGNTDTGGNRLNFYSIDVHINHAVDHIDGNTIPPH